MYGMENDRIGHGSKQCLTPARSINQVKVLHAVFPSSVGSAGGRCAGAACAELSLNPCQPA